MRPARCYLCWPGHVSELRYPDFEIDQLDVIYTGPSKLVSCATRTCNLTI